MSDKKELNSNELNSVSGGGSGTLSCEITFSAYSNVKTGCYYTDAASLPCKVVYVSSITFGKVRGRVEELTVSDGKWSTTYSGTDVSQSQSAFMQLYPNVLNICR